MKVYNQEKREFEEHKLLENISNVIDLGKGVKIDVSKSNHKVIYLYGKINYGAVNQIEKFKNETYPTFKNLGADVIFDFIIFGGSRYRCSGYSYAEGNYGMFEISTYTDKLLYFEKDGIWTVRTL